MALFQISNDKITIQIDSMGAELKSLKDIASGREYMWNADPKYWKRTSPVLFPLVGGLKDGVYRLDGKEYPMGQHGFARDMEFRLKSQTAHEIWFTLESDNETLKRYPYQFILELGYELSDRTMIVKWRVKNPADERMYFAIGGHPAFLCPIENGTKQCDALVVEHDQAHRVSLVKPDGTDYLTVTFDAPLFGIWSPPKKQAPFICIEPWYGRCDRAGYEGDWKEREWMQMLEGKETFAADYKVTIQD